jgi:hypothetical protein
MNRLLGMLATCAVLLGLSAFLAPAAGGQEPVPTFTYTTPEHGATPAQACANSDDVVIGQFRLDGVVVEEFPLSGPGDLTRGACVTTITMQELSTPAYVANCKILEPEFAAVNESGRPYPYAFYGNPDYTANNRADCVSFLRGFHTGTLIPGP